MRLPGRRVPEGLCGINCSLLKSIEMKYRASHSFTDSLSSHSCEQDAKGLINLAPIPMWVSGCHFIHRMENGDREALCRDPMFVGSRLLSFRPLSRGISPFVPSFRDGTSRESKWYISEATRKPKEIVLCGARGPPSSKPFFPDHCIKKKRTEEACLLKGYGGAGKENV